MFYQTQQTNNHMPVLDDDIFELPTIKYKESIYVKIDDIIAWIKDCQANGMDKEATHWMLTSLISCKNGIKNT